MQDRDSKLAADERLKAFATRPWFYFSVLATATGLSFVLAILMIAFVATGGDGDLALKVDFRVFWAAGTLAASGDPLAVHQLERLNAVHGTHLWEYMPWLYPPGFLIVVTPLGKLSFAAAYMVWTLAALVLVALALRPFTARALPVWLLMTFAPAAYSALLMGQTSLFWMAGLLAALAALRDGRSVLAGVFLGVLTLKPQLGVMIAVVLLAVGAWRTILSAVATALAVVILPTLYYGLAYWTLLRSGLERQADWLVATVNDILLMVSPAFFFSMFGASAALAWTLHWILAACAAAAVVLIWRSDRAEFDAKAAGLLSAMLLSAPYLWYYETVLMPAIALFLVRGGVVGARPLHLLLLLPLWVGCGLQAVNVFLKLMDQRWLGATFITPVLAVSLGLCLVHVFRRTPEAGHGPQPARP